MLPADPGWQNVDGFWLRIVDGAGYLAVCIRKVQQSQTGVVVRYSKVLARHNFAGWTTVHVHYAKICVTGRPLAIGNGRFRLSRISVAGSIPSA